MMLQYKAKSIEEAKNILSVLLHLKVDYDVFLDYPANRGTITVKPESEALHCAAPKLLAACELAKIDLRIMAESRFMNETLRDGAKASIAKIDAAIAEAEGGA